MSRLLIGALLACAALTAGCSASTSGSAVGSDTTTTTSSRTSTTTATSTSETTSAPTGVKSCTYRKTGTAAPGKDVGMPPETTEDNQTKVAFKTSQGDITVALTTAKTPCTTRSFAFLAAQRYFDATPCHRLTTQGIEVLQCGDPTGTGTGGPGYAIPDENPTDLPQGSGAGTVVYPRGTVAMANAGPRTGGSQFFLVYGDSTLAPTYAVIGTLDEASLAVVDKVAQGGSDPDGDGKPKTPIDIQSAEAT
ncbi:peptidylprolyl isomerase [Actinokineospora sp. PR83]|uniref:peptidylprolyl isomerase n=1 Tax=Actinokineospora sp. PR83 TaxID=2884908 RepID=UPI001F3B61D0|nr:peptidylprolyl isomerase [Actinokineospora sp. PR83]MCG8919196.1 peptidylprolyl isomerase [Actinokineospora sp. PR83]